MRKSLPFLATDLEIFFFFWLFFGFSLICFLVVEVDGVDLGYVLFSCRESKSQ